MERLGSTDKRGLIFLTMAKTLEEKSAARTRIREIAAEYNERGDKLGWFDEVYRQAAGDVESIPWADLEPNRFFKEWADKHALRGDGRKAFVVGCGLGDDAKFLDELGFDVTAFDISPNAIEWARKLHNGTDIKFEVADLFAPPDSFVCGRNPPAHAGGSDNGGFDFVLEIYTIQPLPMELRTRAIDAVASFVAPGGDLVIVCRGRENGEELGQIPYPLSREDLSRFEQAGLTEVEFNEVRDNVDDERRFIVHYRRPN
jgi:SAM-dependent methyltransferase